MFRMLTAAAAATLALASPAFAQDAVDDFSLAGGGSWAYGYGNGGTSFTQFGATTTNCYGAGFSCWFSGDYQGAGVGSGGAFGTVTLDPNALWLHPSNGTTDSDVIVQYTKSGAAGIYNLAGFFSRLSNDPQGDGVLVDIFLNGSSIYSSTALAGATTWGTQAGFNQNVLLTSGDQLRFVVNKNTAYGWDSTGLSASLTAVPEPGTWAMMIGGFGLAGGLMRRRSRKVAFA